VAVNWPEYTSLARQLADVRRAEVELRARSGERTTAVRADIDRFTKHLDLQRGRLVNLAAQLRLPEPRFGTASPSGIVDVGEALQRAADATNAADAEARRAEELAGQPVLLPGMSPTGRSALIYVAWSFVGWLAQLALFAFAPEASAGVLVWSLCGLPALSFFAGYLTIMLAGQPRVGGRYSANARLGGLICFIGMPLGWVLLIAVSQFMRA
jgi:hypothetical protein